VEVSCARDGSGLDQAGAIHASKKCAFDEVSDQNAAAILDGCAIFAIGAACLSRLACDSLSRQAFFATLATDRTQLSADQKPAASSRGPSGNNSVIFCACLIC